GGVGGAGGDFSDFSGIPGGNGGKGGNASGAGLFILSGSKITLANTLIAQDTLTAGQGGAGGGGNPPRPDGPAGSASRPPAARQVPSSDYALVGDGTGSNLSSGAPGGALVGYTAAQLFLGPLQDNGGPTQTMALLLGSPALDAGSNALVPAGLT